MQRITALRESAFQRKGFDGFLVFNPANMLYFLDFPGTSALLVPTEGKSTIYVYGVNYEMTKAEGKGFNVECVERGENFMNKIGKKIADLKMKKVAVDSLGVENWRALARKTRGTTRLTVKGNFIADLRKVKDKEEIDRIRKACDLTNEGMKTAYEILSSGMKEYEVAAEVEYAMRKRGSYGTAFETAVSSGASGAFPHGGCTDRVIREGDLVVLDFGATYKFYNSDMTRTMVAGKPSEKQKRVFEIVKEAQEKAFQKIKTKARTKDLDAAARNIIEKAGYGEFFVHTLGHGVGLEIHEPPTLSPASKETLSVGNVVTDEPGIYLVGWGGVRIEDTVLVRKDGAERLTKGPYGLTKE